MSTFIKGDAIILYVYDTTYKPIACLTANSLAQTRGVIETQTKCDPGQTIRAAGNLSYEISFEGLYIDTTSSGGETTKASHDSLKILLEAGNLITWKMDTALTDTPNYYGTGIFTDLSWDSPTGDEFSSFSGTLSGSDAIVTVDPNA